MTQISSERGISINIITNKGSKVWLATALPTRIEVQKLYKLFAVHEISFPIEAISGSRLSYAANVFERDVLENAISGVSLPAAAQIRQQMLKVRRILFFLQATSWGSSNTQS